MKFLKVVVWVVLFGSCKMYDGCMVVMFCVFLLSVIYWLCCLSRWKLLLNRFCVVMVFR